MHFLWKVGGDQAVAQLLYLGPFGVGLAQLSLNGPELLAEHVLPLFLAHFGLSLARDLLPQLEHLQLLSQVAMNQPEGVSASGGLEQRLLLRPRPGSSSTRQERPVSRDRVPGPQAGRH